MKQSIWSFGMTAVVLLWAGNCTAQHGGIITTVAGTDWRFPAVRLRATDAPLSQVTSVAVDTAGNLYLSDSTNGIVAKVTGDGMLSVIAGNGIAGFSGDDGLATSASFRNPAGIAVDAAGNIFVADSGNNRVRRISTDGIISTVAGADTTVIGDGGLATSAALVTPGPVALDVTGNLYIGEVNGCRVRKVTTLGIITTIAGSTDSLQSFCRDSGDGVPAKGPVLTTPQALAVDAAGNVYVGEGFLISKIDTSGIIHKFVGDTRPGPPVDGIPSASASIMYPTLGLAVDGSGNVYLSDSGNNVVREVTTDGKIKTIAGTGSSGYLGDAGPALKAMLDSPAGLAVDRTGLIYIADLGNQRVRMIDGAGNIQSFAGNGQFGYSGEGIAGTSANLWMTQSVAVDGAGNLYMADLSNRIRKVGSDGRISTIAGNGATGFAGEGSPASGAVLSAPVGLAVDPLGRVYIADSGNQRVRQIANDVTITTFAGTGIGGFSQDGVAANKSQLNNPQRVTLDANGNVLIADYSNFRVRKVDTNGVISTVAGTGVNGGQYIEGAKATSVPIGDPSGVAAGTAGAFYFADPEHGYIRKIAPTGEISTIAGNGTFFSYSGDGGNALNAGLYHPLDLIIDQAGNLYTADAHNIRVITPDGRIRSVAGNGKPGYSGDGGLATEASLDTPNGVALDGHGNLFIADTHNNRIREVLAAPPVPILSPQDKVTLATPSNGRKAVGSLLVVTATDATGQQPVPDMPFTVQLDSRDSWLSISPLSGVTPALLTITADPQGLDVKTLDSVVQISILNANPAQTPSTVEFTVQPPEPASLQLDHSHLSFTYSSTSPARTQMVQLSNTGGGTLPFTAQASLLSDPGKNWLSVDLATGTLTPDQPVVLAVQADPTGLDPGSYTGLITVTSADVPPRMVTVTMNITSQKKVMLLSQTALTFTVVQNGGATPSQSFRVLDLGSDPLDWSVDTSILESGPRWLSVTPNTGSSSGEMGSGAPVQVSVNQAGLQLSPGFHYGLVTISAQGAANTPQAVVAILHVLPNNAPTNPIVQPASLVFTRHTGKSSPSSQVIQVYDPTGSTKSFRTGITTKTGGNWLVTSPGSATIPTDQPVPIVVQPIVDNLTAQTYEGSITLEFLDGRASTISVQFVVTGDAGPATVSQTKENPKLAAVSDTSCTPKKLLPSLLTLGTGFNLPAGYPQALEAHVVDDCGTPRTDGTVAVQFSTSKTGPLPLLPVGNGTWNGTWNGGTATTRQSITVLATSGDGKLQGSSTVVGSLGQEELTPVLTEHGIVGVTAGCPGDDTAISPGGLVAICGQLLADDPKTVDGNSNLPTELSGTIVYIGAQPSSGNGKGTLKPIPLFYASHELVRGQIPFEVNAQVTQEVILQHGPLTFAPPVYIDVAPTQPGIFLDDQQRPMIFDSNNAQISVDNPAVAGQPISIYCAGMGAVNAPPPDGTLTQDGASTTRNPVTVGIGDAMVPATAALLQGMVGVYQVTATVPQATSSGDQAVAIASAGQTSPAVTIRVR